MELNKGKWSFKQNVPKQFGTHVRESVPFYDEFYKLSCEMLYWFLTPNSFLYDLGSSTGELAVQASELIKDRNINYLGYDTSKEMIEFSKKRLPKFEFRNEDITTISLEKNTSVVFSALTLQFLAMEDRKKLLEKVYHEINIGGALILFEKVIADDSEIEVIFDGLYQDYKNQTLSPQHLLDKKRSLRGVMRPVSLKQSLKDLRKIGFITQTFLQWGDFVGIIALKK